MKYAQVFLLSFFLLFNNGCFSNPFRNYEKAKEKVISVEKKKDQTEDKIQEKSKNYVYAADFALSQDPAPSKQSVVAKEMTGMSLAISGPPEVKEITEFKNIVNGLLSTNAVKLKEAESQLNAKNKEIEKLQNQLIDIDKKLTKANDDKEKVDKENAGLASKWAALVKYVKIFVYFVIGCIVIHILSFIIPPPYNSIFGIISAIIGLFTKGLLKVAPAAKETAGIVAKEVHDSSKEALEHLVAAIEEARKTKGLATDLDPILLNHTSKDGSREIIKDIKRELGI